MGNILHLTDENFAAEVTNFSGVVLVDFYADWCGPCRYIAPSIEKLFADYAGDDTVKITKLDVDVARASAMKFGIRAIPTVMVFKNGVEAEKMLGVQPMEALKEAIEKHK